MIVQFSASAAYISFNDRQKHSNGAGTIILSLDSFSCLCAASYLLCGNPLHRLIAQEEDVEPSKRETAGSIRLFLLMIIPGFLSLLSR